MTVKKITLFLLLVFIVLFVGSCRKSGMNREQITKNNFPAAVIDNSKPVMISTLYDRLADSELLLNGGLIDSTIYIDTLNAILIDSIISLEADTVKLSEGSSLFYTLKLRFDDFYLNHVYQRMVLDSIEVDSAAVDSFYRANPEYFFYQEQVHARHLVLSAVGYRHGDDSGLYVDYSDEQLDSVARDKVFEIKEKIDSGAEFGHMANEYSMHRQSGKADGELGFFSRGKYNKEFEDVVFSLPTGGISEPFKTVDGWHLAQVIEHVDSGTAPLTDNLYQEAHQAVAATMARERGVILMDTLFRNAELIFNEEVLSGNIHDYPPETWAAIINGLDTLTLFRLPDHLHLYKSSHNIDVLSLDDIKNALFQLAQKFIVMQAGDRLGYDKDSASVNQYYHLYHNYAVAVIKQGGEDVDWVPSDSLVEDYYKSHIDQYTFEKPLYVQHIISGDSLFGEYLRELAMSGMDFLELAQEHYPGEAEIRIAAADLGYIGPGEMPDNFYSAAIKTSVKHVSHPVKTEWGYHIIKVLDKKRDILLNEAEPNIVKTLRRLHQKDVNRLWRKDLLARHNIDYSLDKIGSIELPPKKFR